MNDLTETLTASATVIGERIREGRICPVELAEFALDRIEANADRAVFLAITRDRALREAEAARTRIAAGRPASLLDGVPIAWKDNIDIAGVPTTVGSALFADVVAARQDQVAAGRVSGAGMVCMGKLNMTEFAYSGLGLNPHFGTPRNPNDGRHHRSPGGSSSGAGVAVASGLVSCAVGTDTGGSVRVPASFNGVVGYKSSEGWIDKSGVFPLSQTLDTLGLLARSVPDCIHLTRLMRGEATARVAPANPAQMSVLVPTNVVMNDLEPAVAANFEASIIRLERAGISVRFGPVKALSQADDLARRHGTLTAAEAYHALHKIVDGADVSRIDRRVTRRILMGKQMSAFDVIEIQQTRQRLKQEIAAELQGALLAMPTTPLVAPIIDRLEADEELFMNTNARTLRNTVLGNVLNLCGLALPNGRDAGGMPTSILFSAPGGQDWQLLAFGLALEEIICRP